MQFGSIRQAAGPSGMGIDLAYKLARTPEYQTLLSQQIAIVESDQQRVRHAALTELLDLARDPATALETRLNILKFLVLEAAPKLQGLDGGSGNLIVNIGLPPEAAITSSRVIDASTPAELLPKT